MRRLAVAGTIAAGVIRTRTSPDLLAESAAREAGREARTTAGMVASGAGDRRITWLTHNDLMPPHGPDPYMFGPLPLPWRGLRESTGVTVECPACGVQWTGWPGEPCWACGKAGERPWTW